MSACVRRIVVVIAHTVFPMAGAVLGVFLPHFLLFLPPPSSLLISPRDIPRLS